MFIFFGKALLIVVIVGECNKHFHNLTGLWHLGFIFGTYASVQKYTI